MIYTGRKDIMQEQGMPITNRTRDIAEQNGVTSPTMLATRLNIAPNTAYNLWRGNTERIDLPILEKVCAAFGVTPGDILQYVPARASE